MKILITGGSGFIGQNLVKALLDIYPDCEITVTYKSLKGLLNASETSITSNIKYIALDVRDNAACRYAVEAVDVIYHLAAFKHVRLAENNVRECVETNVIGTLNLLQHFRGKEFISISTDKAAQISGVYGASKFLMEKAILDHSKTPGNNTKYTIIRFGNILYSTGSVLTIWKPLLEIGAPIDISNYDATRFFWSIDQAIDSILTAQNEGINAVPYIPSIKSMRIGDLLKAMIEKYSPIDYDTYSIIQTSLEIGDNEHEILEESGISSKDAEKYTIEEIKELI